MSEWINVNDDLPNPFNPVWIFWINRKVVLGVRIYEKDSDYLNEDGWYSYVDERISWAHYWIPIEKPKKPGKYVGTHV